jgi:hypothetical protein
MKCTACGNENQPDAKFCVHCGIVLVAASAPAWTAVPASAAPAAAPPSRPAAPAQPAPTPAPSVARAAAASGPPPAAPAAVAAAEAPESSPKTGLIIGVVALLVILGAGGYFGYRMLGGSGGKETVAIVEPPKPAASPPMVAPGPATGAESKTVPSAPTGVPLPGRPSTAAEGTKADSGQTKAAPKAAPPGSEVASKAGSPPVAPAPPSSKALAKAPAVAPTADRWQMMAGAMAQCSHAQFFSRLACEQRTRNQYCEGYWGQIAQCPSAPTKDHGQ